MPRSIVKRAIVAVTAASGLITAGALPAVAANPAAYHLTIGASSRYPGGPVAGYTLVIYRTSRYDTATISGHVRGFRAGDVATLLAKPFRATKFTAVGSSARLAGAGRYSFTVRPSLATQYKVRVSTSGRVDVTSSPRTVYVIPGSKGTYERLHCSGTRCKAIWHLFSELPASAYRAEARKHWYLYLAVSRTRPEYLPLISGSASKPRRISAGEYEVTLTFPYRFRRYDPSPWTEGCSKDTESRDGIGLPRRHDCGDKRVKTGSNYLG